MRYNNKQAGEGFLDKTLYSIPYELHIPGYKFCGPNTNLNKRRNDVGVNELDNACKEHDLFYEQEKDLKRRHKADEILAQKALQRLRASNASVGEKIAALGVVGAMKAKVKLGMSYKKKQKKNCSTILNNCKKCLEKAKISIQSCLQQLEEFKSANITERKKYNRNSKSKIRKVKNEKEKNEDNYKEVSDVVETTNIKKTSETRKPTKRKREDNDDNDDILPVKTLKLNENNEIPLLRRKLLPKKKLNSTDNNSNNDNSSRKRKLVLEDDGNDNGDDLNKKIKLV